MFQLLLKGGNDITFYYALQSIANCMNLRRQSVVKVV